ncbi:MAG: GNAT family N-acetyltransferase [Anaerolineae bacterium]|nr:GNAT family N-acetyltransferase [Anaerolineae bacterium]
MQIQLEAQPDPADRDFIHQQIRQFNNLVSPQHLAAREPGVIQPLCIFIHDDMGQIVGGLTADTYWNWLDIDDFWIQETLRRQGFGQKLLTMAEAEARRRGCWRAQLKTFDFQARDFYARFGYRVVGVMEDYPPGGAFYWMRKDFEE